MRLHGSPAQLPHKGDTSMTDNNLLSYLAPLEQAEVFKHWIWHICKIAGDRWGFVFFCWSDLHNHCRYHLWYGSLEECVWELQQASRLLFKWPRQQWGPDFLQRISGTCSTWNTYHTDAFNKIKRTGEYGQGVVEGISHDREYRHLPYFWMHSSEYGAHHFCFTLVLHWKLIYGKVGNVIAQPRVHHHSQSPPHLRLSGNIVQ